ncbi:MAG: N-acetyl-gamma-glutamyl-phosphate reductase, partial [Actinobacteria bacterium]|nr:N-acetyl-gamma-glutamyl-phosphate reductase [Actinomycetota bacterium]
RLIDLHPSFEVVTISAHSNAGEFITTLHPQLSQYAGKKFSALDVKALNACDLVFLALPHGQSAAVVSQLSQDLPIIDLGADYRLADQVAWKKYYGGDHAGTWTYGLPELNGQREQIKASKRIANPGCYATAIALASAPILDVVQASDIVVVAASGTTGAGRSAKVSLLGSEVMGSLSSYKFGGVHQHTPEIEQALSHVCGKNVKISFTPVLAPMPRGILATVTAVLSENISQDNLREMFNKYFDSSEFVSLLVKDQMPRTSSLTGSNYVHLQCAIDTHTNRVVVSVAIDNLGKGAAGQAIQNANLIMGLDESAGLLVKGLGV